MWQKIQEKYGGKDFTVVGLALDSEGIAPAKLYYDKYGVKFPALVDPNYATKFGAVPKTFFINEHGVVQKLLRGSRGIEQLITSKKALLPVTDKIRAQWSSSGSRLEESAIAELLKNNKAKPTDLNIAVQLASRFLDSKRQKEALTILQKAVSAYKPKKVALGNDANRTRLLGEAYLQMSRACKGDRKAQVKHATMAFYLKPSLGYAKQISRIIAPEKFDNRPRGDFDNEFRESTRRRLYQERKKWLSDSN